MPRTNFSCAASKAPLGPDPIVLRRPSSSFAPSGVSSPGSGSCAAEVTPLLANMPVRCSMYSFMGPPRTCSSCRRAARRKASLVGGAASTTSNDTVVMGWFWRFSPTPGTSTTTWSTPSLRASPMPESSSSLGEPKVPAATMTSRRATTVVVAPVVRSANSTPVATAFSPGSPRPGFLKSTFLTSTPVRTVRLARPRTSGVK